MRGLGARTFGVVFLFGVCARAQAAATEPGFRIQVADCPEEIASRLPAVVKLEIDVLLRERGPTRVPPESIAFRCEEDKAHIEVTMGGSSRSSNIDLRALSSEHRARALGLAAAELVHSISSQARAAEGPPSPPPSGPNSTEGRERPILPPRRSSPRPVFLFGGLAELLGKPVALLLGGRLGLYYPLGPVVAPAMSVDGALGSIRTGSAEVTIQTVTAAAHVHFGTTTGRVLWEVGPGAGIGWVHLVGQPAAGSGLEGHAVAALWGGPELRARIAYLKSGDPDSSGVSGLARVRSPALALELGGGFIALPVRGLLDGSEPVYSVQGPWASVCAEVGLGL
jgi:hypothetical protein